MPVSDLSDPGASWPAAPADTTLEHQLSMDILSGRLEPGARLRMSEMMARYSVGMSPIREALARLSGTGLVQLARNHLWSFPDCIVNGTFTVPGDGDIDFAALLDVLIEAGYAGWLVVEAEQDPAVAPSYVYAKKGYDTLRAILVGAHEANAAQRSV